MRSINLQGVMQNISRKQRLLGRSGKPHSNVAARMTRRWNDGQSIVERMLSVNDDRLSGFDDRQNAVAIGKAALKVRLGGRIAPRVAQVVLEPGKDIFCFGESWNPTTVLQHRIPADVIGMKMGAEDDVDIFRRNTCISEPVEVGVILLMKSRKPRTILVITSAAIEQDRVMSRSDKPRMNACDKSILLG